MTTKIRCAIYTRKSTDDGLEQEFNSLDAQREACEAYIASQRGLGWIPLSARYDDGGISGGTMERPGLRALLGDIARNTVDLVVVYKVDRLTRSLADFAKIVDVFDSAKVSFVSVTQQFNTSTSMGRLTLNMLLSFAQFEREVTGERIRDKIAASKQKGMWMGGVPPLGYDVRDKKLVVNATEAETIRTLFQLYLELGTVRKLLAETKRRGLVTKRRKRADGRESGGRPFTRGHLYQLLTNPLYAGEVIHKGKSYPGQHQAIIERQTFLSVRQRLESNSAARQTLTNAKAPSLLTGLVYDETGDRLCPTHANKKGRRYRYYISKRLMHRNDQTENGWRLPAKELEDAVVQAVGGFLRDELQLIDALRLPDAAPDRLRTMLTQAKVVASEIESGQRRAELLRLLIRHVLLHPDSIRIALKRVTLAGLITSGELDAPDELIELTVPMLLKRRGVEAKLILSAPNGNRAPDESLSALLAQAHHWFDQISTGEIASVREIARSTGVDASDISRTIQLALLAPDIGEAIMAGRQPTELTARRLKRIGTLPLAWDRQRRLLGFSA